VNGLGLGAPGRYTEVLVMLPRLHDCCKLIRCWLQLLGAFIVCLSPFITGMNVDVFVHLLASKQENVLV